MAFDIEGARKSGYSDSEIADYLGSEKGFDVSGARKAGYGDADIVKHLTMLPQAPAQKAAPKGSGFADALGSVVNTVSEPIAAMATGVAGQVAGGLAGIGGAIMPGPPGQGADVAQRVSQAMTYEPRSAGGKAVMGGIAKPFEWLAGKARDAGNYTLDKTNSPALATAVDTGINMLPMAAGGVAGRFARGEAPEAAAARAAAQVKNSKVDAGLENARSLGLAVSPEDANAGMIPRAVAGIAGEPKLQKLLSKKNAPKIDNAIADDLGLPRDVPISRKDLQRARAEAGADYEAVKNTGTITTDAQYTQDLQNVVKSYDTAAKDFSHRSENPFQKTLDGLKKDKFEATSAVEEVKLLRGDADDAFRSGHSSLGRGLKAAAQALDDQIARHVEGLAASDPAMANVATDYLAARQRIAKTYTAEKALNDATGNFDAAVYARELKKGKPLSGPGEQVAKFAAQFPRAAQRVERTGSTGPTLFDMGMGFLGKDALLLGARPIARAALSSNPAQRLFANPGNYDRSALSFAREEAMRKAGLLGLMGQGTD